MSIEQNKAIARRYFEELWNQENLAVVDESFAADFVGHGPPNPLFPTGDYHGHEGQKQLVTMYRSAFPDGNFTIERVTVHKKEFRTVSKSVAFQSHAFAGCDAAISR